MIRRRRFLTTLTAATASLCGQSGFGQSNAARQFTMSLRCGSIGVSAKLPVAMELASRFGFEAVTPDATYLEGLSEQQSDALVDRLGELHLVWGAAGLPVEFRRDETTFTDQLGLLPGRAAALQRAGVTRVGTYIMPRHDELTYRANFRQHADRLRRCARVLADHGQRLGLEYVGPKTLWTSGRYSFVHTMAETRELIAEINVTGVGLVLDSWHWYTAQETRDDLLALSNRDVVACDLNDAPSGLEVDRQIDSRRELPAATGVIDLRTFLSCLIEIGYDGPVRAEPFNERLNLLEDEAAVSATAAAMKRAFALV